jgi:hypothetical protein
MRISRKRPAGYNTPSQHGGPRCAVCRDPRLIDITTDVAHGMSHVAVAKKYGFTQPVVWKHAHQHMGLALLEHALARPVLEQMRAIHMRTLRILEAAERKKDPAIALDAIREARRNLELVAKLTGELKSPEAAHEPVRVEIVYVDKQLVVPRASDSEPPSAIESGSDA